MQQSHMFTYSWHIDEEETNVTAIRVYGINQKNESVCLKINDFTPYTYIELPTSITWNNSKASIVGRKIDEILGREQEPLKKALLFKKKLYYAHLDEKGQRKVFPFLFCSFSSQKDMRTLSYKIKSPIRIAGLGCIQLKMHEYTSSPILQYTSQKKIPTAGWISFIGKPTPPENKITRCTHEYTVRWMDTKSSTIKQMSKPLLMGFDIEVNSSNPLVFPNADKPGDKIFQISCILSRYGDPPEKYKKYLLTLGTPNPIKNVEVLSFVNEGDLLAGFTDFVNKYNPNILVGYNIMTFDIPYMIARAKHNVCMGKFDKLGFLKNIRAKERVIKWSSTAFKNQEFEFLDAEGRLFVDLIILVRRDYKFSNYQLKTVAPFFLKGLSKKDLSPQGIFKCYRIGMKGGKLGSKALAICGDYCIQDSVLMNMLFNKLQTWVGLSEKATVCNVPIFYLYTKGQQITVYSQVYKLCTHSNFVVDKTSYISNADDHYVGATVFEPIVGVHNKVIPLDFSSFYPNTIRAYNLCYSTLVINDNIPDEICHVMSWKDCVSCEHDPKVIKKGKLTQYIVGKQEEIKILRTKRDTMKKGNVNALEEIKKEIKTMVNDLSPYVKQRSSISTKVKYPMCTPRYFRWLKEPIGVLPQLVKNLIDARTDVKKEIKVLKQQLNMEELTDIEKIEIETQLVVLDKRQLALKVSSNSVYGATGVHEGYLPMMQVAMSTTYMCRKNIAIVADVIPKKYNGKLIYGDSVTEDTPILCKINGKICYRTIDNLPSSDWTQYKGEKEEAVPKNLEVWTDTGFTKIRKIIRHKTCKEIFRVLTHTGVVDVTEDHGLLDKEGIKISPKQINKGSELLTHDLPPITVQYTKFNEEEAFVMGMFYADGSCGDYNCPSGRKCSWAVNNADRTLLEKCELFMNNQNLSLKFKILETMESSAVLKLVPTGKGINDFVIKWRQFFYDKRRYKKVPDEILWSDKKIKQAFLDGYYCGDGDKDKHGYYRFDNKGKIGAAGLFYLANSLDYKVSINTRKDKLDVYRLTCTKGSQRKKEYKVKKIISLGNTEQYVYDLETENHHFSAGIGKLIVHNTDSNYISFPHLSSAHEIWEYSEYVAAEVSKLFPESITLAFEEVIYWRFMILTKKRYMSLACGLDGVVSDEIQKKGVLLARRDNCQFIRDIYGTIILKIFHEKSLEDIIQYALDEFNKLCSGFYDYKKFIMTKSVGSTNNMILDQHYIEKKIKKAMIGQYKINVLPTEPFARAYQFKLKNSETELQYYTRCLPSQVQLAQKMKRRGQPVEAGTRLEYVITTVGGHKAKQYIKIEHVDYYKQHSSILQLDYLYYLKQLTNHLDQVFNVIYKDKLELNFTLNQYKFRSQFRSKLLQEIRNIYKPVIKFIE
jgi:DNA polymerase elongation subunit (family B)